MPSAKILTLLEDLRHGNPELKEMAAEKLRDLGPAAKEAVQILLDILQQEKDRRVGNSPPAF